MIKFFQQEIRSFLRSLSIFFQLSDESVSFQLPFVLVRKKNQIRLSIVKKVKSPQTKSCSKLKHSTFHFSKLLAGLKQLLIDLNFKKT